MNIQYTRIKEKKIENLQAELVKQIQLMQVNAQLNCYVLLIY